jgi:2-aminoadipate transaminase
VLPSARHDENRVIDRLQRRAAAAPDMLSLAGGLPAQSLFPRRVIGTATLHALRQANCTALQYGWPEGAPELRAWIAARLAARGATVTDDDVIITSGAQQAIALAIDTVLDQGDAVSVDAESYPAALDLFRARGLIPTTSVAASMAYVMHGATNPKSVGVDRTRLRAILDSGAPIIADEAYAELRFDGVIEAPLLVEAPDRTFHVGTFSKTLCPGFRIGWLIPPRARRADVVRLKAGADLQANSLSQSILSEMVRQWDYDAHLARARRVYARRADALLAAIRRWLPSGFDVAEPEGGFSIFLQADMEGDDARLLELAAQHGTAFDPGRLFRAEPAGAPLSFRLCHSSIRPKAIAAAVERLARAFQAFGRDTSARRFATHADGLASHRRPAGSTGRFP